MNRRSGSTYIKPTAKRILLSRESANGPTVADRIAELLRTLGINAVFGIAGGAIAPVWDSLDRSNLNLLHFRHESGAVFAAIEAYFATGVPVAVCVTSGPGITNALTGLHAARADGAKVLIISGATPRRLRNHYAFQETSPDVLGWDLFSAGPLFHYAALLNNASDLGAAVDPLADGLARPGGFVAHLSIGLDVQSSAYIQALPKPTPVRRPVFDLRVAKLVAKLLAAEHILLWLGFGARTATSEVRELVERTGVGVLCSPRAKGIFPEDHPAFVGTTGLGATKAVVEYLEKARPDRTLVLGTRLGEMTSFWQPDLVPPRGFIHVDIDPRVPRSAYPNAPTIPVVADVKEFLRAVIKELVNVTIAPSPAGATASTTTSPCGEMTFTNPSAAVRPRVLMAAIQRVVVDGSQAIVLTEAGNSFVWANHSLRFRAAGRYRVSTSYGSMGHAVTGVVGAAYATGSKAVALVGDGAMLMNNEISTAVQYRIPAAWVVLNDSGYGMVRQGMHGLGYKSDGFKLPCTDFAQLAHSMGARGIRVYNERELDLALNAALTAREPFVVDVVVDSATPAPFGERIEILASTETATSQGDNG